VVHSCKRVNWSRPIVFILQNDWTPLEEVVPPEATVALEWSAFRKGKEQDPNFACLPPGSTKADVYKAGADFNCNDSLSCSSADTTMRQAQCAISKGAFLRVRGGVQMVLRRLWTGKPEPDGKHYKCFRDNVPLRRQERSHARLATVTIAPNNPRWTFDAQRAIRIGRACLVCQEASEQRLSGADSTGRCNTLMAA
jgi:hypothetical protein